jgi:hypothetical protein
MFRGLRAESRKIFFSRAFLGSLGLAVGLSVMSVLVDAAVAGKPGQPKLGSIAEANQMFKFGPVTCVVLLILGILASGGEYRHQTMVSTVLLAPRRSVVVGTKAGAVLIAGVVLTTVTLGLGLATIYAVLATHHFHTMPADWIGLFIGTVVASTFFGLLGAALGFIARSTVGAVVAFVGWVLFGELIIIKTIAPHIEKWLPVGLSTSLTNHVPAGASALATPVAAAVLAGYVLVLLAAATLLVVRRDVA